MGYGKCPKIWNTKVFKQTPYANSVDPDQTAPEGTIAYKAKFRPKKYGTKCPKF